MITLFKLAESKPTLILLLDFLGNITDKTYGSVPLTSTLKAGGVVIHRRYTNRLSLLLSSNY